ncbi:hypothetical protein U1Q18_041424 [Sarracenia purpurea var. burkii]
MKRIQECNVLQLLCRFCLDERAAQRKGKPEWVESFLQRTFFSSCAIHEPPKNELNKYCTDCNLSVCRHCIDAGSHAEHKVLQIYRHVYKDVVPLREMEKHIDCSKIQAYKCNKQLVIALNPLPHSGSQTTEEAACDKCKRKLLDPNANRYCSIACKSPESNTREETQAEETEAT